MNTLYVSDRRKAILRGTAENVTCEELRKFLREAQIYCLDNVAEAIRNRYWKILDDPVSRLCQLLNIAPEEHKIGRGNESGQCMDYYLFFVDGFPDYIYELLFSDQSPACATVHTITRAEKYLKKVGNDEALLLLRVKCADVFAERDRLQQAREKNILAKNGLPEDVKYDSVTWGGIDGLSFQQWKILNLPEYSLATKAAYSSMKNRFMREGDYEKVDFITTKYQDFLKRTTPPPEFPIMEQDEAYGLFEYILSPEYRQHLIEQNKEELKKE